ncbi:MAG TPA: thioredoxin family protein, partial [Pyrinomonadaceae bacterium]
MINCTRLILIISLIAASLPIRTAAANPGFEEPWLDGASGYNRAIELQRELKVPLIVYFYTDWCPYCHELDASYFPNPAVQDYLRGVVKVRINPENGPAEREIADRFSVTGYPRFYVIRTPTAVPRNLQPFRRGGVHLTPEQFAMSCQQFAPVTVRKSAPSQMLVNPARPTANVTRSTKGGSAAAPAIVS